MNAEHVLEEFKKGFDCSQVVLSGVSERFGIEKETAYKVSACFGGGMWCGKVCGAVTGGLMAIGLKYGHSQPSAQAEKSKTVAKIQQFRKMFEDKYESIECRDILGYDLSKPDELKKIMEEGLLTSLCPKVVSETIDMLGLCLED